ncbi:MAG: Hpt domain-containing protein [Candidatus Riflebacteria bacterium]|nr:Hpt domain-containing protein [Candidatus Riflebacteria bacterium]
MTDTVIIEKKAIFDPDCLKRKLGSADSVREILNLFLAIIPVRIDELKKAFEAEDRTKLKSLAHSIKGNALNVGGLQLTQVAYELEQNSLTGEKKLLETMIQNLVTNLLLFGDEIKKFV